MDSDFPIFESYNSNNYDLSDQEPNFGENYIEYSQELVDYPTGSSFKIKGNDTIFSFLSYTKDRLAILVNNETKELVWVDPENIEPI